LVEVQGKEQVLRSLEKAASNLRAQLGESLSSIQKFDTSLEQATTSSLEALQAYSLALQKLARGGDTWDALPFLKRAIELDPNFAMANARLGEIYSSGGPTSNDHLAKESLTRAFLLRDLASEREKLYLASTYYENATRELDKAADGYELWKWTYPRDVTPYDGLAGIHISTGQFERAADNAQRALLLQPKRAISYERLAGIHTYLNRLDEAKAFCLQASAQKIDGPRIHWKLYMIAHLENDLAAMEKELDWATSRGETTRVPFYQGLVAAANGQLRRSEGFFQQTMDVRLADHDREGAALAAVQLALIEAHFGYRARARERAATSLRLLSANTDLAALALAAAGDGTGAKKPMDDLLKAFPQDTLLNNAIAPVVTAQIELNHDRPRRAIDLLRSAQPYEFGADNAGRGFMAIYLRGQAYLRMHTGEDAATEFQKIIDHPGIDPFSPLHSLAYLGRARSYALQADKARARDSYAEFFTRWKNADSDLPILRQAKAEYAGLQSQEQ
jgi:tetratricopeptide (TPR) repeat protein